MKLKQYFALLVAFSMLLAACKKGGSGNIETPTKKKKYLTQVVQVSGGTTTFTNYTYDAQKRLVGTKQGNNTTTYLYNGNELISETDVNVMDTYVGKVVYTYKYLDGTLQTVTIGRYADDKLGIENVYSYVFNGDKITEKHFDDATNAFYSYDSNGNTVKIEYAKYTETYTYSDKKDPAIYNNAPNPTAYISPNILLSMTRPAPYGGGTTTYAYTYDKNGYILTKTTKTETTPYLNSVATFAYDSDGYITAQSVVYEAPPSVNTKFTFIYSEL